MTEFFNGFLEYLKSFASQYSFFITGSYYSGLFSKYFSVAGFIIGFIFVLLVYFSSAEEQKKAGFFKVLPIIAVINSCMVLSNYLNDVFDQGLAYSGIESIICAPDNIISGFILTLVVYSCYQKFSGRAFLFGIATHAALPMLNFAYFGYVNNTFLLIQMVLRILLVGFLCIIISKRKNFFTSWIWYFGFHFFIRVISFVLPLLVHLLGENTAMEYEYTLTNIIHYFSRFTIDFIVFAIILVFAIVFEKGVLKTKPIRGTV